MSKTNFNISVEEIENSTKISEEEDYNNPYSEDDNDEMSIVESEIKQDIENGKTL